jgi:DNA polymerase
MSLKYVSPSGNIDAKVMLIGEAPGEQEELQGKPFVGKSGKLLDKMLEYLNLTREEVYITNVVKIRPENNRTPTNEEIVSWKDTLEDEIIKVGPDIIITLGTTATKALLGLDTKIGDVRGKGFSDKKGTIIVPTYHPAYLLRNPPAKEIVKKDLDLVKRIIEGDYCYPCHERCKHRPEEM